MLFVLGSIFILSHIKIYNRRGQQLTMSIPCFLLLLYLCGMFSMKCQSQSVPNLYAFGDSMVGRDQKKSHASGLKTCRPPYGIECLFMDACRFTNGWTVPDIIASKLDVSKLITVDDFDAFSEHGVIYASASAGILPETGTALGNNYCMEKQVNLFKETIENKLRPKFPSKRRLSDYLANSIYLINIGSSDYIYNYLQPDHYNSSRQYSPDDFAELLTKNLGNYLKELYNLGARKMVVFQIGPLGCLPYIINRVKPRSRCAEDINKLVSVFNDKLNIKIKELSEKLNGSAFVTVRAFNLIKSIIQNPADYGLKETRWPCCVTQENGTGLCEGGLNYRENLPPNVPRESGQRQLEKYYLCRDVPPLEVNSNQSQIGKPVKYLSREREFYLFFDELHLTLAANKIIVNKCLNTTSEGVCSPYGIYHLAEI